MSSVWCGGGCCGVEERSGVDFKPAQNDDVLGLGLFETSNKIK